MLAQSALPASQLIVLGPCLTAPGMSRSAGWPRGCGAGAGLGGAGVLAGRLRGLSLRLGLGCGFGGPGLGGDRSGLGAAACSLGLGDLGPDLRRIQAGGLLTGRPGQHSGLPDHAVQRSQRAVRAVRGRRRGAGAGMRASLW